MFIQQPKIVLDSHFNRKGRITLLERFHVDGYLLLLLTILAIANLFILYLFFIQRVAKILRWLINRRSSLL